MRSQWQVLVDGAVLTRGLPGIEPRDRWATEAAAQLVAVRFVAERLRAGQPNPSDYVRVVRMLP